VREANSPITIGGATCRNANRKIICVCLCPTKIAGGSGRCPKKHACPTRIVALLRFFFSVRDVYKATPNFRQYYAFSIWSAELGINLNKCLRSLIALSTFCGCAATELATAHEIKANAPDCASLSSKTQVSNERVNSLASARGYKVIRFWEPAAGKLVLWPLFFSMDPEVYADADAAALQHRQQTLGDLLLERCVPQQAPHTLLVHPTNPKGAGGVSTKVR
jgi:hypothetical protein